MKNPDPSFRHENESQFSETDSVNETTRHVMQVSKAQPGVLLKLALLQTIGTAVFSIAMLVFFDAGQALSALYGGAIAAIGSLYSAGRLFTTKKEAAAIEILNRFYASVVLKIIFTLTMMGICISVLKVSLLPFIISYLIAAVIMNMLVLLVPARLDIVKHSVMFDATEDQSQQQ